MLRPLLTAFSAALLATGCAAQTANIATTPAPVETPPGVAGAAGVAAANDPRVGPIGEAVMAKGGSATDAAIAMMLALAVVEPQSSGIGGGGFLLRGDAEGHVTSFDGRETAPAVAQSDWFLNEAGERRSRSETVLSGLSIGVPGAIALAAEAHAKHGRLPWADLFVPAITLARDGFALTPRLSGSLASFPERGGRDPRAIELFYPEPGDAPPDAGTLLRLPDLADTLELIAEQGPQAFYSGDFASGLAEAIAADTPRSAGMVPADIETYRAQERAPLCSSYREHRVCAMGPPSSGGYAVIATLKQLERFDLAALGLRNAQTWHLFLEAQKLAYADRGFYIADADFVHVPIDGLMDPDYLASRSALIQADQASDAQPGQPQGAPLALAPPKGLVEHGTTHFVAVHSDGTMVSYTATVEGAFGSGLFYRGFYLNNELTDFSIEPGSEGNLSANRVEGGKRPMSSMAPTVVYDPQGKPLFALGAAGGGLIPVQTARAIIAVVDFGLPLEEALGLPFVMSVGGGTVLVEQGTWMEELGGELAAFGHERIVPFGQLLRTTGALHTDQGWQAAYDPRLSELVRIPAAPESSAADNAGFSEGMTQGSGSIAD